MDFRILGPLEVRDDGRPLRLGGARQRALLALLLVHANEVVSSDRLVDQLWTDAGLGEGSKALHVAVSRLRSALEPDRAAGAPPRVLITRAPGYELRVAPGELDLHVFEELALEGRAALAANDAAAASDRLGQALALWRGPPLADLAFEPSLQTELTRLEELRLAALEDRLAADLALGRHAAVVSELEALVAQHPLRERPRAQLMLALYGAGRQAEALEVYRDTRQTLVEELGIEPGRELKELERRILDQDPDLDPPARPSTAPTRPSSAPAESLVGRDSELAELVPVVESALSGHGALVLVGGEPGIGKSRLADALAGHARRLGARVLVGRCWEAGGAPAYWPWVQALRSHIEGMDAESLRAGLGREGGELAALLPELREHVATPADRPPSGGDGARFRLFESVAAFLRRAAAEGPLALFLDDLHAADAPSLLVLRFVASQLAGSPILIVGCYRDTEVSLELADALAELRREPVAHRVALHGLGRTETARLLEATMLGSPGDELAERVHAETDGNPLFAGEIGRLLASEGWPHDGGADATLPIPDGVREAIGRRLQRQSYDCRKVLTLASVIGREFSLEALERASGLPQRQIFEALEEAVAARLVSDVPGARGHLRFAHVLVRDALYDGLPPTRRLQLHRQIGDALERLHAGALGPHSAELAHHYLEAGSLAPEKAIHYAEAAGDRAASQHGYEEAARHYAVALRLLESSGSGDASRICELLLALGEALSRAGRAAESKQALERAAELAERIGRPDQLARAAIEYGGRFAWERAGTDPGLVPLLERALAAVGDADDGARARLLARLAAARRDDPERDHRVALAEEAVTLARRSGDPASLLYALEGKWIAAEGPDLAKDAVTSDQVLALAEQSGDHERLYAAHEHRFHRLWMLADRAAVDVELASLERLADELRQPAQRWHLGTVRSMVALMEGRLEDAERLIAETRALGERGQSWNAAVSEKLATFVLRREQGRLAEIESMIERAVHEFPAQLRFRCALAHVYAELGRERQARALFDDLMSRDLEREHVDAEWSFSMALLPAVCASLGDRPAAGTLYSLLSPYADQYALAPIEASFGSLAGWLGVLATCTGNYDDAERHFEAALEVERRMRARPWLAHARHDLGSMLLARGDRGDAERAAELLAEARAAYRELGMEAWAARAEAAVPATS